MSTERPMITAESIRDAMVMPRSRWRLFGVTRRDITRAKARLISALEVTR